MFHIWNHLHSSYFVLACEQKCCRKQTKYNSGLLGRKDRGGMTQNYGLDYWGKLHPPVLNTDIHLMEEC